MNHPSEVLEIGQNVRVKVLDIDRERQRISLGLKQTQSDPWQQVLESYGEGDVVEGQISNIVDFGAFVDLDGMDGLIHISELSWSHVNHPSEVLEIGQDVKVKVLDIDRERQRISLGLKQTQSDPWQQVLETYNEGDTVEGKVTKVVTFPSTTSPSLCCSSTCCHGSDCVCLRPSEIRWRSRSMSSTFTFTVWPISSTSDGWFTCDHDSSEM